jgi:hypothetical protein
MLILKENGGTEKNWQLIFYAAKIKDTFKLVANKSLNVTQSY